MKATRYVRLQEIKQPDGFVPFGYSQVIHESGRVGPYHPDGLTEAEHAEVMSVLAAMPAHMTYADALFHLAYPDESTVRLDAWRARESGRMAATE